MLLLRIGRKTLKADNLKCLYYIAGCDIHPFFQTGKYLENFSHI